MRIGLSVALLISVLCVAYINQKDTKPIDTRSRVGLLVMATGKYSSYVDALLDSADRYFCKGHEVSYIVFTDGHIQSRDNLTVVHQEQLGWPYDTMMRFAVYYKNRHVFEHCDYLFACDADMLFVNHVGSEMFGNHVATIQPNYLFDAKPYERNPLSTACINRNEGKDYFAGGFYGASKDAFITLTKTITDRVSIDLARGYIAVHNDESHLNRYFVDHVPDIILSPSYCHFEHWSSPYPKKIVALVKTVSECNVMRKKALFNPIDYYKKYLLNS